MTGKQLLLNKPSGTAQVASCARTEVLTIVYSPSRKRYERCVDGSNKSVGGMNTVVYTALSGSKVYTVCRLGFSD